MVLVEAIRFWFAITPRWRLWPTRAYLQWRLGTVYGSFNRKTGKPRWVIVLLWNAWRDRRNVVRFLRWRRRMRVLLTSIDVT